MQIDKQDKQELAELVATAVVNTLEKRGLIGGNAEPKPVGKTAYQKTEQLLYNYNGFKRIVAERQREIEEIRLYGVPKKCGAVGERVQNGNLPKGIVLEEETVEDAIRTVERSVQGTVQAISLIDKCLSALENDPYYPILEMRYFEGRTQEDIAVRLNCAQKTVSVNKARLVRELSMRLFPDQVVDEMMN